MKHRTPEPHAVRRRMDERARRRITADEIQDHQHARIDAWLARARLGGLDRGRFLRFRCVENLLDSARDGRGGPFQSHRIVDAVGRRVRAT